MDVMRRNVEDPVEQRRWKEALLKVLENLHGKEFPQDEADTIQVVIDRLKFDEIVSYEETAEEQSERTQGEVVEDDSWDFDHFVIDIDEESLAKIRSLPIFKEAERLATPDITGRVYLEKAVNHIEAYAMSEIKAQMRKVLDWYVFQKAEQYAIPDITKQVYLEKAAETVRLYASSSEIQARIRGVLDKYVFKEAERLATPDITGRTYTDKALKTINDFSSSEGRRQAMLKRLGFM
jgi:hypothetical protein